MGEARAIEGSSLGFFDRNDFALRRIHSLTGVVPLILFMMEHMFTNAKAAQGPEAFHGAIDFLTGLPGLYLIEVFFILLPLYFHGLYGVYLWGTGRSNLGRYGEYGANWRYSFQRWSGIVVLVFVTYHLLHWRFGVRFPWNADAWSVAMYTTATGSADSFYAAMHREFSMWWMFAIYTVGLLATMYHLANGLWTFAITWGLTRSRAAQRRWGYVCAVFGVVLFLAGLWSLAALSAGEPFGVIQPIKTQSPLVTG